MSYASLSVAPFPSIAPEAVEHARRLGRDGLRMAAFTAQSVMAAAFVWLMLAGPGLLTDHASTTAARAATAR